MSEDNGSVTLAGTPSGDNAPTVNNEDNKTGEDLKTPPTPHGLSALGQISQENQAIIEARGYEDWDSVLDSVRSGDQKITELSERVKQLSPPAEDADGEAVAEFMRNVSGAPETADGYEFKMPDGLPDDFAYDDGFAGDFKEQAHKIGLSPSQAQALHDMTVSHFAKSQSEFAGQIGETQNKQAGAAADVIKRAWGDPDSDGFAQRNKYADAAIRELGLKESLIAHGVLGKDDTVFNGPLLVALSELGELKYSEDVLVTGEAEYTGRNPFSEGATFNLTEQARIRKTNPKLAERLERSARST